MDDAVCVVVIVVVAVVFVAARPISLPICMTAMVVMMVITTKVIVIFQDEQPRRGARAQAPCGSSGGRLR